MPQSKTKDEVDLLGLGKEIRELQQELSTLQASASTSSTSSACASGDEVDMSLPKTRQGLREALLTERVVSQSLREENEALRQQLAALQSVLGTGSPSSSAIAEPAKDAGVSSLSSHPEKEAGNSHADASALSPSASAEHQQPHKPKTMAALFANRKPRQPSAVVENTDHPPPSDSNGPSLLAQTHERRKAELMQQLAEDDAECAEDPFVAEARKKHLVINTTSCGAGVSAVGFNNGPNPRGYYGGSGGVKRATSSMEGSELEVRDAMRRAVQDNVMDDRRAVLEAEEDAKLAARLQQLRGRK